MPIKHGAFWNVLPTLLRITQTADVDVPVFIGLWPVHRIVGGATNVDQVYVALDAGDTLANFGYDPNFSVWTGCEAYYACFTLFNANDKPSPIFSNVFNPAVHFTAVPASQLVCNNGIITIPFATADVIIDSVVVKNTAGTVTLVKGVNYIAGYDQSNNFVITILDPSPTTTYTVSYNKANPAAVVYSTIVGGTDVNNVNHGLAVIEDVFPKLSIVPGILYAPGWMNNVNVALAADAKVQLVNGIFRCRTMIDIDNPTTAKSPQGALAWKGTNATVDSREDLFWPPILQAGVLNFHAGTLCAIQEGVVSFDKAPGGGSPVPYWGISNNLLPITGIALSDGTPIKVSQNDATFLNSNGIITFQQFREGWFTWGDRTAAYPVSNDVTQVYSIVQRELDWIGNSLVLTLRPFVDNPGNFATIESIMLTAQVWLSSLVSSGALLKGLIEFLRVDNPLNSLLSARLVFHYLLTPPLPAEDIENNLEFDVTGLNNLFSLVSASATSGVASGGGLTVQ